MELYGHAGRLSCTDKTKKKHYGTIPHCTICTNVLYHNHLYGIENKQWYN